jgi:hypothetical protein
MAQVALFRMQSKLTSVSSQAMRAPLVLKHQSFKEAKVYVASNASPQECKVVWQWGTCLITDGAAGGLTKIHYDVTFLLLM